MMTARRPGMWTLWLLAVAGAALSVPPTWGDTGAGAEATAEWTIVGYLSGEGDLGPAAERYLEGIAQGAGAAGWNAAVLIDRLDNEGACAARRYLWRAGAGEAAIAEPVPGSKAGINMGDATTLAELLGWARREAPAKRYALIVMGHGASGDRPAHNGVALDAGSGGDGLTSAELAGAIRLAGGDAPAPWLDAVFVDCCYSGSLEMAYELRGVAEAFCGSPGPMPNPGTPWQEVLGRAGSRQCAGGRELVEACLQVVAGSSEDERPVLCGVTPAGLAEAGACLSRVVTRATQNMAETAPAITLARSQSRTWGGGAELCDAAQFAVRLSECASDPAVCQPARELASALERSTIAVGGPGAAGMSLLLPGLLGEVPAGYRQAHPGIAVGCGWAEFVEAYTSRLRDLMQPAALSGGGAAPTGGQEG